MRAKVAAVVLLLAGLFAAAHTLVGDRALSPPQLEKVRTVCPDCHGEVPEYDRAIRVHNRHAAFDCRFCHGGQDGLKTPGNIRGGLKGTGAGVLLLALLGIIANMSVIKRRDKAL